MRLVKLKNLQNQKPRKKENKKPTFRNAIRLLNGRRKVLNGFESKIFPM